MTVLDLDNLQIDENKNFNLIAKEIRSEYNSIIESVSEPYVKNISWMVGSIASRNKYYSSFFMRLCIIAFVQHELTIRPTIDTVLISDRILVKVLQNYYRKNKKQLKIISTEKISTQIWNFFRPFRQYIIGIISLFLRYIGRSPKEQTRILTELPITLIDTFVLNNSGDEGGLQEGVYRDRYYPGLLDQLTEDEKKTIFFVPTLVGFKNFISAFNKVRHAHKHFIIHDDFLKFSDYYTAFLLPFNLMFCRIKSVSFREVDVTLLLKNEKFRTCSDLISLTAILYYRFVFRLAEKKIKIRLFVDWYENQVIDRSMIAAFHRFLPQTKVIGYQGYIIAKSLHFYTCPNVSEYVGKAVPDVVYVVGRGLKESVKEFCKDVNVEVAPGFRFQKLWRKRCYYPDPNVFTILIGLPIELHDCAHMLHIIIPLLPLLYSKNIQIWIKPHPTWSPEQIKKIISIEWPRELIFKTGDFHDVIESCHLLLSNASSVSLEALAKGTPVIIVGAPSGITQNPIPENVSKDRWQVIYTSEQCLEAIHYWYNSKEEMTYDDLSSIRSIFFEPVNRVGVLKFLDLPCTPLDSSVQNHAI